jgi:capsular polysaccharide biosynthesis protein
MEEQMLTFAHATHIVGVEGAALANILFATQAASAIVLQSPNASRDTFFSDIAAEMDLPYKAITGWRATSSLDDRSADFILPLHLLEAHLP